MPFLKKFLKRNGAEGDLDEDDEILDWTPTSEIDMLTGEQGEVEAEDPGMNGAQVEQANDISRFNVSTLKLEEETETVEEGLEAEVPEEASTVDCAGNLEGAKEEPGERDMSALLQIFEDEAEVDQELQSKASWVEDVDAEELVEDLRSLMDELESL